VALSGHADRQPSRSLSGVRRTWHGHHAMSANDPKRTTPLPRRQLEPVCLFVSILGVRNMASYKGACSCGAVRFELSSHPLWVLACHCDACKKRTGSAYGVSVMVENGGVRKFTGDVSRQPRCKPRSAQPIRTYRHLRSTHNGECDRDRPKIARTPFWSPTIRSCTWPRSTPSPPDTPLRGHSRL
jgi:Glutathione-dependent formaldehyde-activating enzyme